MHCCHHTFLSIDASALHTPKKHLRTLSEKYYRIIWEFFPNGRHFSEGVPWCAMIYLSTNCHILPLTGLNAFVYAGFNAQKRMGCKDGNLCKHLFKEHCSAVLIIKIIIIPSQMEVGPLHCTVDIAQKRRLFKNTKEIEKM